jgi:aspartate/methionine/tyrosine aminotransferase
MTNTLSNRGTIASNSVLRVDFDLYFEANNNLYHKKDNPKGAFPLNMAENKLCWSLLKEKLQTISQTQAIADWVPYYTSCLGDDYLRAALANHLSKNLCHCPIHPDHLGVSAGATPVIELSSWILAAPGDVAVFPAPCYPVYKQDVGNKANVERYDLLTHHEIKDIFHAPALTIPLLEKTKKDIESQGKRFRMLVLTNPDNPTGGLFSIEQLEIITDWCLNNQIHLIVNEIYGLTIIDTNHPNLKEDYPQQRLFTSFAQIIQARKSPYLHLWYALSKDLGISGLRVGCIYTLNETLLKAYDNLNAPSMVSNHTQWLLAEVLKDEAFMSHYIAQSQQLLTESYALLVTYLRKWEVPYAPSRGSLFAWVDFSKFLKTQDQAGENDFWENIYTQTGVLLTPGQGFGHSKKGQFRIVYTSFNKEDLEVALKRLDDFLEV